jgi:hypothetical protein
MGMFDNVLCDIPLQTDWINPFYKILEPVATSMNNQKNKFFDWKLCINNPCNKRRCRFKHPNDSIVPICNIPKCSHAEGKSCFYIHETNGSDVDKLRNIVVSHIPERNNSISEIYTKFFKRIVLNEETAEWQSKSFSNTLSLVHIDKFGILSITPTLGPNHVKHNAWLPYTGSVSFYCFYKIEEGSFVVTRRASVVNGIVKVIHTDLHLSW